MTDFQLDSKTMFWRNEKSQNSDFTLNVDLKKGSMQLDQVVLFQPLLQNTALKGGEYLSKQLF